MTGGGDSRLDPADVVTRIAAPAPSAARSSAAALAAAPDCWRASAPWRSGCRPGGGRRLAGGDLDRRRLGAASGGLVGSLTGAGVSREEAHVYAEGVKRGGTLVTVRADEAETSRIEAILARSGSSDWQQRRTAYGSDWKGFDETSSGLRGNESTAPMASLPGETAAGYAPATDPNRRL